MDRAQVEAMSGSELVAAFNRITGKKVKRFASRADGVKRLLTALGTAAPAPEKAPAKAPASPEGGARPQTGPASAPAPAKGERASEKPAPKAQGKPAPLAHAAAPDGKLPRPGSKRAQLLDLLRTPEGATVETIMERFGWKANDAADALRLLARKNWVAVARGDDGRWRA